MCNTGIDRRADPGVSDQVTAFIPVAGASKGLPVAKFLGAALADHFAVALPFNKSTDSVICSGMDKTVYPRAALLESLVRFATADPEH